VLDAALELRLYPDSSYSQVMVCVSRSLSTAEDTV